jgi:hypothetical protein
MIVEDVLKVCNHVAAPTAVSSIILSKDAVQNLQSLHVNLCIHGFTGVYAALLGSLGVSKPYSNLKGPRAVS